MDKENKKFNFLSRYIDYPTLASIMEEAPKLLPILDKLDGVSAKIQQDKNKGTSRIVKKDYTTIICCPVCEFRLLYSYNHDNLSIVKDNDITITQLEDKEDAKQVCETLSRVLTRYAKEHSVKLDPSTKGFVSSSKARGPYNKDPLRPTKMAKRIKDPNRLPTIKLPLRASHGDVIPFIAPARSCPGRPMGVKIPEGFQIVPKGTVVHPPVEPVEDNVVSKSADKAAKRVPEVIAPVTPQEVTPPIVVPEPEVIVPTAPEEPTVVTPQPEPERDLEPSQPIDISAPEYDFSLHMFPGFLTDNVFNYHKCTCCSEIVKTPAARRKHVCGEEQKRPPKTCRYCNEEFKSKSTYYNHISICETEHNTNLVSVPKDIKTPIQYKHTFTPQFIQSQYTKRINTMFEFLAKDILVQEVNRCFKQTIKEKYPRTLKTHRGYNKWECAYRRVCCVQAIYSICKIIVNIINGSNLTTRLLITSPEDPGIVYSKMTTLKTLCDNIILTTNDISSTDDIETINKMYITFKLHIGMIEDTLCDYTQ